MKKIICILLAFCITFAAVGCGGNTTEAEESQKSDATEAETSQETDTKESEQAKTSEAETMVLKLGLQAGPNSRQASWCDEISQNLEKLSGGTMRIEIVANGQLGSVAEHFSQLDAGTLDILYAGWEAPSVVPGGEDFSILVLPFLFNDLDHVQKFAESDIYKEMQDKLTEKMHVIQFGHFADEAPRALTTSKKAVHNVDDLKGLVIRVPSTPLQMQVWSDMGANPTQAKASELLEGLQTGRFDAQENSVAAVNDGYFEYQSYYMELDHTFQAYSVYVSSVTWDKLTEEQQGWFADAVGQVKERLHNEYFSNDVVKYREALEAMDNIEIIPKEEVDMQSFIECVAEHVADYEGKYFSAGLYEQIRALDND